MAFRTSPRNLLCAATEAVILVFAFLAAAGLRFAVDPESFQERDLLLLKACLHAAVIQVCMYYGDLYQDHARPRRMELFLRVGQAVLIATLFLALFYFAVPSLAVGRRIVLIFVPLAFAAIFLWRCLFLWASGTEAFSDAVLILGTGQSAQRIAREILRRSPLGYRVVGFLSEHSNEVGRRLVNPSVIGTVGDMGATVEQLRVTLIVVALDDRRGRMPIEQLLRCRLAGVRVVEGANFFEELTGKILVKDLRPSWLVFSQGFSKPRLLRNAKRAGELVAALAVLAVAAPLMAVIALLVKLDSPGPVLYRQVRVGEKGRLFSLIKFRTMRADAEAATGPVWATANGDDRVTRLGSLLRIARLDELPQLFNVLRGEMSFVGPRPERPHFVEELRRVIPYYDERHSVKPGITGWAQIKFGYGSNIEDAEEKLQFDLFYIKHMSPIFDVGILLDTLKVVLVGRGAR
jgi:sugar transferase (PEP-CTERM system associated)